MSENQSDKRILVVDDEIGMREGCRRALSPLGYHVETADSFAQAQALVSEQTYDLCLLDVMLPDGSGLDLVNLILQAHPDAICIIITGYATIELAIEATRRGAYDFLSKPFTSDELTMAVRQGLEQRRLKDMEARARELSRAKEELEELDRAKSQFMLKVAHELRAPVAAVQSYINLLLDGYLSAEEQKPTLERIRVRLQEMLDLVADLLNLAHLKQTRDMFAVRATRQSMAEILAEVVDLLGQQARAKDQTLTVLVEDHPQVTAQRDHLEQIWMNLLSNAIKYTPSNGHIEATLGIEGDQVIGIVQDSGIGISKEDQERLYQEFFRTEQAKASGEPGTGLGLSIVKQILDTYGGDIRVDSQPDIGTRFTFTLPVTAPDEIRTETAPTH